MGHRVDASGAVKERGRADEKAPDEHLPRAGVKLWREVSEQRTQTQHGEGKQCWHERVEAVQENQFWIPGQIFDLGIVGGEILAASDPTDVRPKEAMNMRRVRIFLFVRMLMVVTMMVCPPECTALHGGAAPKRKQQLAEARCAVGLVREIAVINARDRGHAKEIQSDRCENREFAHAHPDYA